MTVLERCGLSNDAVRLLRERGLAMSASAEPYDSPLRSDSEEWFFEAADCYTPPLSNAENTAFGICPTLLSHRIVNGAALLLDVSSVLQNSLARSRVSLDSDLERASAVLSISRIFHSCLDGNYLKYDRQLEYMAYPGTPVGRLWAELLQLVGRASSARHRANDERWATDLRLRVLTGGVRVRLSGAYSLCCAWLRERVLAEAADLCLEQLSGEEVSKLLNERAPDLHGVAEQLAKEFHRTTADFVADSLAVRTDVRERLTAAKAAAERARHELKSLLGRDDGARLDELIDFLEDLASAQEVEGAVTYGPHPATGSRTFALLWSIIGEMEELTSRSPALLCAGAQLTQGHFPVGEGAERIFLANRRLLREAGRLFSAPVLLQYEAELLRWK